MKPLHVAVLVIFQSTSPVRGTTLAATLFRFSSGFQSTSPVRGTTYEALARGGSRYISIHVPREGDDITSIPTRNFVIYFNPRPP